MRMGIYIALLFLASACERTLDIDLPEVEQRLVLNALGNTDEHLTLHLSTNVDLLGEPVFESNVGELRLVVGKSGFTFYDEMHTAYDGSIKTAISLEKGDAYHLVLHSDQYPVIEARDTVPAVEPVFHIDQLVTIGNRMQLDWTVEDQEGEQFYMIQVYKKGYELDGSDTSWSLKPVPFTTSNPIFISRINSLGSNPHFALFRDQLLQGNARSFLLTFDADHASPKDGFYPTELKVEVQCLSRVLFQYYLRILENNHVYGGPLASGGFDDGNVVGGLGVFGCYTAENELIPF